jgi:4-hydroxy-3-methylbut-2-enyl diphosphate reductase
MKVIVKGTKGYCQGIIHVKQVIRMLERVYPVIGYWQLPFHNKLLLEQHPVLVDARTQDVPIILGSAHGLTWPPVENHPNGMFYDVTCQKIKKERRAILNFIDDGGQVIILGQSGHPEVKFYLSLSSEVFWWGDEVRLPNPLKPLMVTNQTSLSKKNYLEGIKAVQAQYPYASFKIRENLCPVIQKNLASVENFPDSVVLILGDEQSSNAQLLVERSKAKKNPTYLISTIMELEKITTLLTSYSQVVLIAATSTDPLFLQQVSDYVQKLPSPSENQDKSPEDGTPQS